MWQTLGDILLVVVLVNIFIGAPLAIIACRCGGLADERLPAMYHGDLVKARRQADRENAIRDARRAS